jgi:hypothetical protein
MGERTRVGATLQVATQTHPRPAHVPGDVVGEGEVFFEIQPKVCQPHRLCRAFEVDALPVGPVP